MFCFVSFTPYIFPTSYLHPELENSFLRKLYLINLAFLKVFCDTDVNRCYIKKEFKLKKN